MYADLHGPAGLMWLWSHCVLLYTHCQDAEAAVRAVLGRKAVPQ